MNRPFILALLSVVLIPGFVAADESKPKLVHKLDKRVKDRTYTAINNTYTLDVPDLGAGKTISISDSESRPGITAHVTFVGDNGAVAGVVTTKIRPDYPKDDRLLDRVKPRYAAMARQIGKAFQLVDSDESKPDSKEEGDKKGRRFLQFTYANEQYDKVGFPYILADHQADDLKTMGIHRLLVRNGHLYEIIMILPVAAGDSAETARKKADEQMATMMKGLTPK